MSKPKRVAKSAGVRRPLRSTPAGALPGSQGIERGKGRRPPFARRSIVAWLLAALTIAGSGTALRMLRFDGASSATAAAQSQAGAALAYADNKLCVECHRSEADRWANSHHFMAMAHASEKTVRGDFSGAVFSSGGVRARFFKRHGKFMVRAQGADGEEADFEIKFTFGVEPLQQYLIELSGGRLQAFDIAWDVNAKRWFSLQTEGQPKAGTPLHWTGREYNWNYRCANCHSTGVRLNYDAATGSYATAFNDANVACQACHGPGSAHIAAIEAGDKSPPYGLAVDFRANGAARQIEICARCHSRRRPITMEDAPSEPFLDHYIPELLAENLYHADGQILDEVFELGSYLQSRMHQKGVACTRCHDAHSAQLKAEGNAVCTQCHNETPPPAYPTIKPIAYDSPAHHHHAQGSAGALCVNCHMPAKTYMVVHPRRDHSLRPPRPDLDEAQSAPDACTGCHRDRTAAWAAKTIAGWYGSSRRHEPHYGAAIKAGRLGAPGAAKQLIALSRNAGAPEIVRASAVALLDGSQDPEARSALAESLHSPDPLVRIGAAQALRALPYAVRLRLGAGLLDDPLRAVRVLAAEVLAPTPERLMTEGQSRAFERAAAEFETAQMAAAGRPEARLTLGAFYGARGQTARAEAEYRAALALDPLFAPAMINLADLYRAGGRVEAERDLLQRALAAAPDNPSTHYALGLFEVRQKRYEEALGHFRRAAQIDPGVARYSFVYAVALDGRGRRGEAIAVLRKALESRPFDPDLLLTLAHYLAAAGDRAGAQDAAQRFGEARPYDPRGLALLAALRQTQ